MLVVVPLAILALSAATGRHERSAVSTAAAATPAPKPGVPIPAGAPTRPPVVVLIFDELPNASLTAAGGRLDAARYPNFARLASRSTWFPNASTVADGTYVAVPAILGGRRPRADLKGRISKRRNIFTLLGSKYRVDGLEPLTSVCSRRICHSEASGAVASAERATAARLPIGGSGLAVDRLRTARARIHAISRTSRPSAHVLHMLLPHVPWQFFPDGRQYNVVGPKMPGLSGTQLWSGNAYPVRLGMQRHFLQLKFADRVVGELIDRLRSQGLWDDALVIVTADHGVSFRPGGYRRPVTRSNFSAIANVPIFLKLPRQEQAAVSRTSVQTVDVLPTVAKVTGLGNGWRFQGHTLTGTHPGVAVPQVRNGRSAKVLRVPFTTMIRERDAWVRRQLQLFPPGNASLYRLGPFPRLLGRRAETLPHAARSGSATLEEAAALRNVRPKGLVLPAWISGTVRGIGSGRPIAVSLNGRIAAVGSTFRQGGVVRYTVIVPPSRLRRGANTVSVFTVVKGSRLSRLR